MPQQTRLDLEREALQRYFPGFRIQDPFGPKRGVIGRLKSNTGTWYTIWLALSDFPNGAPQMYIIEPRELKAYDGRLLSSIVNNRPMHLLTPDANGHPQICHYNGQFWLPKVSLYKILMKARIWLEAYEQHLRHGRPIDTYLSHME
jgi:hypothetical protein